MKLIKKIFSEVDKTVKYVFKTQQGQAVEYSYIDNGTGKDIICTPSQTMCNMLCTFCHLTDHVGKIKTNNLTYHEIIEGIDHIASELHLGNTRPLLISFMGAGEPMANMGEVFNTMITLLDGYDNIRFGLATMLPKSKWPEFFEFTRRVKEHKLPVKIHLSLHFTNDSERAKWMPSALDIKPSLAALEFYHLMTGNPTEVHYTIMDGLNDGSWSLNDLNNLIHNNNTTIKLMKYSEKDSLDIKEADRKHAERVKNYLLSLNPERIVEYYEPPGADIYSACGQFLSEEVLESNLEIKIPVK